MASALESGIVLDFHDSLIRATDLQLLDYPNWLNDTLVGFGFEYFERIQFESVKDEVGFVGPSVTQLIKLVPGGDLASLGVDLTGFKLLLLALNDETDSNRQGGGSHWSLLAYEASTGRARHYDSCHGSNAAAAADVSRTLGQHFQVPSPAEPPQQASTPQQTNGCDCGLYTLATAEHLAGQVTDPAGGAALANVLTPDMVTQKRLEWKRLILRLAGRDVT